jgi:hypothetical protein
VIRVAALLAQLSAEQIEESAPNAGPPLASVPGAIHHRHAAAMPVAVMVLMQGQKLPPRAVFGDWS